MFAFSGRIIRLSLTPNVLSFIGCAHNVWAVTCFMVCFCLQSEPNRFHWSFRSIHYICHSGLKVQKNIGTSGAFTSSHGTAPLSSFLCSGRMQSLNQSINQQFLQDPENLTTCCDFTGARDESRRRLGVHQRCLLPGELHLLHTNHKQVKMRIKQGFKECKFLQHP